MTSSPALPSSSTPTVWLRSISPRQQRRRLRPCAGVDPLRPRLGQSMYPMSTASTATLIDRLRAIVGRDAILTSPSELLFYECDGVTIEKNKPDVVVFPTSTEQVVQIVQVCDELNVPFVP